MDSSAFLAKILALANGNTDEANAVQQLLESKSLKAMLDNSTSLEQQQMISSLRRLLKTVNTHGSLAWSVIDGLEHLCSMPMHQSLSMEVQKMIPEVAQLISHVDNEQQKKTLLQVLVKMTYGVKFHRPESFIGLLINSLVEWSKTENTSIIQLSLSVLVNLLHRNKSVQSIFIQTVSLKQFMNDLLLVKDSLLLKMEVCKLMFLLEDVICENLDETQVLNFLRVTICSINETSRQGSKWQLEHCVSFFEDMVNNRKITSGMLDKPCFIDGVVKNIIPLLEAENKNVNPDVPMLIFRFLRILVEMELSLFYPLYENLMQQGVAWVSVHGNETCEAVNIMYALIASQSTTFGLSAEDIITTFLPLLTKSESNDDFVFLTTLLRFLRQALDMKTLSVVKNSLKKEAIELFIRALPGDDTFCKDFTLHEAAVKMYVTLFSFVFKCATSSDASWLRFYTEMLREPKVISVLSVGLACGSADLKSMVLSLIHGVSFPQESFPLIAKTMEDCGKRSFQDDGCSCELSPRNASNDVEIQKSLKIIKNSLKEDVSKDSFSVKILQLYEYKEQMQVEYQQSLLSSLSNASKEISGLREINLINDQITSDIRQELYCLHLTFEDLRQKYQLSLKANEEVSKRYNMLQTRLEQETVASQKTIKKQEESIQRLENEVLNMSRSIKSLKAQLTEKATQIDDHETQREELLKAVDAMKEKAADQTAKKEEIETQNSALYEEVARLKEALESNTKLLDKTKEELVKKTEEIQELQRLRDIVCELTSRSKP